MVVVTGGNAKLLFQFAAVFWHGVADGYVTCGVALLKQSTHKAGCHIAAADKGQCWFIHDKILNAYVLLLV